ncbi:MAG: 7-carboxy-7-deazaguanine synthase QueE [Gammaproteobacteria bacterium]|nr:7-carboxy-7-deazaguanine synthase QueE [Gammaproteobacteria bacterium]PCH64798.1 MAG: 7-carboxy-7-deazaguanine synthase QueE [Gammaproteobacteria bacterium]
MSAAKASLRISEIFCSLQGEARDVGFPTVFVRLTGCPLRCVWCDTEYAFHGGETLGFDAILSQVAAFNTRRVTVSGGEPLAQKQCVDLLALLCDQAYQVSLETSGAIDVSQVDQRVVKVVDVKPPGSGESSKNRIENFRFLNENDQLKFVISDRADYDWSLQFIDQHDLVSCCELLFSPVYDVMPASDLANWLLADQRDIRLQIQLHKYLWGEVAGT